MHENVRALNDGLENLNDERAHQEGFYQEFCQKILKIMSLSQNLR